MFRQKGDILSPAPLIEQKSLTQKPSFIKTAGLEWSRLSKGNNQVKFGLNLLVNDAKEASPSLNTIIDILQISPGLKLAFYQLEDCYQTLLQFLSRSLNHIDRGGIFAEIQLAKLRYPSPGQIR